MSLQKVVPVHVWAVVDTHYQPLPVAIDASCNRDVARQIMRERNVAVTRGKSIVGRFIVVECFGEVALLRARAGR